MGRGSGETLGKYGSFGIRSEFTCSLEKSEPQGQDKEMAFFSIVLNSRSDKDLYLTLAASMSFLLLLLF